MVLCFWIEITWSWQSYFCLTVRFYVLGVKWLGHNDCNFYNKTLSSKWKWHALFVCSIYDKEEITSVEKTSIILFCIKENQLCGENIYIVFVIVREMTTSWNFLMTISPFLWAFIQLKIFYSVSTFNGFSPLVMIHAITRIY